MTSSIAVGGVDMAVEAARLAEAGFRVFRVWGVSAGVCGCGRACDAPGKHPLAASGWQAEATRDPARVVELWRGTPNANVGIATGEGWVVVDVDGPTGEASLAALGGVLPPTLEVRTARGRHLYFRHEGAEIRNSAGRLGPKLDVRGTGGLVVAPPSVHATGVRYEWVDADADPAVLPAWFAHRAGARVRIVGSPTTIREGGRNEAMTRLAGAQRKAGLSSEAILAVLLAENAARCRPPLPESELESIARSSEGWAEGAAPYYGGLEAAPEGPDPAWEDRLERKPDRKDGTPGGLVASVANAATILAHDPRWVGVLALDELSGRETIRREPPWFADDRGEGERLPRAWSDADDARLGAWLSRAERMTLGPTARREAVAIVARRSRWHPVREYFEGLAWDGQDRMTSWLSRYAGAALDLLSAGVGRAWLISAVARTFEPGCQADYMLILEGAQEARKSSTLATLVPNRAWFSDTELRMGDVEALKRLRGKLIVSIDELASMRRSQIESVKSFVTSRVDDYRDSYGARVESHPRRCVLAGTVNPEQGIGYLADPTGLRRFWPVAVRSRTEAEAEAALAALERDRDQLWAEAVAAYRRGEQWHPNAELRPALAEAHDMRRDADDWEPIVATWLASPAAAAELSAHGAISGATIARCALNLQKAHLDKGNQMRVARAIARYGWVRGSYRDRVSGVVMTAWAPKVSGT